MNNSISSKVMKLIRWLILIGFVGGIALIVFFHFENRTMTAAIETTNGKITLDIPKQSADQEGDIVFNLITPDDVTIKRIRFYGRLKSICLLEYTATNISGYLNSQNSSYSMLDESGKYITMKNDGGRVVLDFAEAGSDPIKALGKSHLLEKIVAGIYWAIGCLILYLLTVAYMEKKENKDNHGPIYEVKKSICDIREYWEYTVYAAKTDLKAEVANSYLNRLWWLLEPFFSMMVYVIVFGRIMGQSLENYSTFIFASILMFNFFSKTINYSVKLVRNNRDIITKVYVPKFVLLISDMILNMFKLAFSLVVLVPMLVIYRVPVGINVLYVIPVYITLILLSFGLGMILLHFGVYVDDLSYAIGILLNMLMFLSGIFYDVLSSLPSPLNIIMMSGNPVAMLITSMRDALLYNRISNVPLVIGWAIISVILCFVGVHIVYKNENAYVKMV